MPPFILLSFLFGAVYSVLFHLWRGKNLRDLVIYILAGVMGFFLGQGLGNVMGFDLFLIGPLHMVEATLTSWVSLFLVHWLKV
jgi:uncharacterized membrane protein YfcA